MSSVARAPRKPRKGYEYWRRIPLTTARRHDVRLFRAAASCIGYRLHDFVFCAVFDAAMEIARRYRIDDLGKLTPSECASFKDRERLIYRAIAESDQEQCRCGKTN